MDESNLLKNLEEFNANSELRTTGRKGKKKNTFECENPLYEDWELVFNAFKIGIFPIKSTQCKGRPSDLVRVVKVFDHTWLKTLTPKQMLQRLLLYK